MDCVFSETEASVLVFSFWTDNTGLPLSIEQVTGQFAEAQVFASTPEGSVTDWLSLAVVTDEIRNTWIQGEASDPLKIVQFQGLSSGFTHCLLSRGCVLHMLRVPYIVKCPSSSG